MTTTMESDGRTIPRRRDELRDFLRTRRAAVSPEQVGLPRAGRRRTPGLRREDVASLAGVGLSWYTWLEQGRDITVSTSVLDAISATLQLDDAERVHLYLLAGHNPPAPAPTSGDQVLPTLHRIVEEWTPRPAYVVDRYATYLAGNTAARQVFGQLEPGENLVAAFVTSAAFRARVVNLRECARSVVADFRASAARYPEDAEFGRIADRLRAASDEFAELWARHDVHASLQGPKLLEHPTVGRLSFELTTLQLPEHPELRLRLLTPRPGTGTRERLERALAGTGA